MFTFGVNSAQNDIPGTSSVKVTRSTYCRSVSGKCTRVENGQPYKTSDVMSTVNVNISQIKIQTQW